MSATPPGIHRVSLRSAPGIRATSTADRSGGTDPDNVVVLRNAARVPERGRR